MSVLFYLPTSCFAQSIYSLFSTFEVWFVFFSSPCHLFFFFLHSGPDRSSTFWPRLAFLVQRSDEPWKQCKFSMSLCVKGAAGFSTFAGHIVLASFILNWATFELKQHSMYDDSIQSYNFVFAFLIKTSLKSLTCSVHHCHITRLFLCGSVWQSMKKQLVTPESSLANELQNSVRTPLIFLSVQFVTFISSPRLDLPK